MQLWHRRRPRLSHRRCDPEHAGAPFDAVVAVAAIAALGLGADRNRTTFNAFDALAAHVADAAFSSGRGTLTS